MRIIASGLSRLLQHITTRDAGVVSAYLDANIDDLDRDAPDFKQQLSKVREIQQKVNITEHRKLGAEIRALNYGFIELSSKWEEGGIVTTEQSYFIPNASKEDVIKLGAKYDQFSVLHISKGVTEHICTSAYKCGRIGNILQVFVKGVLSQKDFEGAFSLLKKGSKGAKNTRFKLLEVNESYKSHF